ncbi:hypothetical protein [Yersinia ruckeri]
MNIKVKAQKKQDAAPWVLLAPPLPYRKPVLSIDGVSPTDTRP